MIVAGYLLIYFGEVDSTQALVIAPIILTIGYCIMIPVAILYRKKIRGGSSTG